MAGVNLMQSADMNESMTPINLKKFQFQITFLFTVGMYVIVVTSIRYFL